MEVGLREAQEGLDQDAAHKLQVHLIRQQIVEPEQAERAAKLKLACLYLCNMALRSLL